MKKTVFCVLLLAVFLVSMPKAEAQTQSLKGISLNGSTGLYSIPSGRIGWERSSDLGLDFGYHAIINGDGTAHVPTATISLFKWVEISTAFDIQPDDDYRYWDENVSKKRTAKNDDLLFGFKVQLPTNTKNPSNPAVALGTNIQLINFTDNDNHAYAPENFVYTVFQFYAAATYAGTFFTMPAETTVVVGKTLYADAENNSDIDFGMGFDLILLPDVFQSFVHWIIDFANFDYSDNSWPNKLARGSGPPWYRGILNTGIRLDLANIPALSKFKFVVDVVFNDLFDDDNRSFTVGAVFGIPIL
ncbi:MAG: hypothetical protein LBJ90_00425 [Treponema sp.]|jgi:hypothetical protein|nr:hypothetical protein [Treponema sp.]